MRKHNSPVNNRSGMNRQNSSIQHSQGNEGKRKNERKSTSETDPLHEVPNSVPGFSDSKPIGKKPKSKDDFIQADVKNQQNSSETKESDPEVYDFNPKPSKSGNLRREKGKEFHEESEEETEYTE